MRLKGREGREREAWSRRRNHLEKQDGEGLGKSPERSEGPAPIQTAAAGTVPLLQPSGTSPLGTHSALLCIPQRSEQDWHHSPGHGSPILTPQGPPEGSACPGGGHRQHLLRGGRVPEEHCSLFLCTSALSIPHSTFAVNHFLFRLTAEGL